MRQLIVRYSNSLSIIKNWAMYSIGKKHHNEKINFNFCGWQLLIFENKFSIQTMFRLKLYAVYKFEFKNRNLKCKQPLCWELILLLFLKFMLLK